MEAKKGLNLQECSVQVMDSEKGMVNENSRNFMDDRNQEKELWWPKNTII